MDLTNEGKVEIVGDRQERKRGHGSLDVTRQRAEQDEHSEAW